MGARYNVAIGEMLYESVWQLERPDLLTARVNARGKAFGEVGRMPYCNVRIQVLRVNKIAPPASLRGSAKERTHRCWARWGRSLVRRGSQKPRMIVVDVRSEMYQREVALVAHWAVKLPIRPPMLEHHMLTQRFGALECDSIAATIWTIRISQCPPTFRWRFFGIVLRLQMIEESCATRVASIVGAYWKQVGSIVVVGMRVRF